MGERQRKRKSPGCKRSQYVVKSVDEITKEDLDNIAYRSKDKIWDKENVSHCRPSQRPLLLHCNITAVTQGSLMMKC